MTEERRTRLIVDIVWNGEDSGRRAQEEYYYYEDRELPRVATDWIEDVFSDRDDSPEVTVTAVDGTSGRGADTMSGYRHSGLTEEAWEARHTLRAALALIQDRWPDGLERWPAGAHFHTLRHLAFLCEQIEKEGQEPTA